MRNKLFVVRYAACAAAFTILFTGCSRKEADINISVSARSAVIMEIRDSDILYQKNPEEKFPPASTAKVMTAIVAIENLPLSDEIVPNEKTVHVEPTVAGLKPGVKYRLADLIKAILVKSANDAALVIAEAVAGSEKEFAVLMNAKAKEIGMENTYFATASGLPMGKKDAQYTTSMDLAKMMRYALQYPIIPEYMAQKDTTIYGSDNKKIYLKTHNKSLFSKKGASWGKTGYTREARRTFVGIDPSRKPRIIIALLKSNALWSDISTLKSSGLEIYELRHRHVFSEILRWISNQRERGRAALEVLRPAAE
ncbi:MAG: serine hydrolase [Candidatus Omnitrophota bacterium]